MRKMCLAAIVASLIVAGAAADASAKPKPKANTLLLGDLGGGASLWLVLDSVRQDEAQIRHGWSIINYQKPQTAHDIAYSSDASKFYVNCKTQNVELANTIKFSEPMGGGKNVFQANAEPTPEPNPQDYHPAHPNTAEEAVLAAICKQKIR